MLPRFQAQRGQPAQLDAEEEQQHRRHYEVRYRDAQVGDEHHGPVKYLIVPEGRDNAHRDTDDHGQQDGDHADAGGNGEFLGQDLIHRKADALVTVAQIQTNQALEIHPVLFEEGFIQAVFAFHHCYGLGAGTLCIERTARDHVHQEERNGRDHEQRQQG